MPDPHVAHTEPDIIAPRPILLIVFGFFAFVAACLIGLYFFFRSDVGQRTFLQPRRFSSPQLEVTPLSDLEGLQNKQREQLTGYAWADKDHRVARIPIDRAMQIIAEKGKDGLAPLQAPAPTPEQASDEKAAQALKNVVPPSPQGQK